MCSNLEIKTSFSFPFHPQANGQVEDTNKIIKNNLKPRLDKHKGSSLAFFGPTGLPQESKLEKHFFP